MAKPSAGLLRARPLAWVGAIVVACVLANGSDLTPERERLAAKASDAVVKVEATSDRPDAGGKTAIRVKLTIQSGWHLAPNPAPASTASPPTTIALVTGKKQDVRVQYPPGRTVYEPNLRTNIVVYVDEVVIPVSVTRASGDTGPLELSVRFQACCHLPNQAKCLMPAEVRMAVP